MPAVAVIPAPSVYAVIAAVKTLVVRPWDAGPLSVVDPVVRLVTGVKPIRVGHWIIRSWLA